MAELCKEITGDASLPTQRIYLWVTFFSKNEERLTHLGKEDEEFFTKVLYAIDIAKESYQQDCCNGFITTSLIDFVVTQNQILSHQFYISLPLVL
eukprot:3979292-Ditylum_brightwellii.AAC.1